MPEELSRYLTDVEKEQLNALLSKAMERKGEYGKREYQFLFTKCQKEQMEEEQGMLEVSCKVDFKKLLKEFCDACKNCDYGYCPKYIDEELPF